MKIKIKRWVKGSRWFNEILFNDCKKFWTLTDYNIDVVNLGSSSGVHAFNYEEIELKGKNWAMSPQSLLMDFAILKNYVSYLKNDATVIISLCPFSCFVGYDVYVRDRYYTIIRHNTIPGYKFKKYVEVMDIFNNPERYYPLFQIIGDIKYLIKRRIKGEKKMVKTEEELESDSKIWIGNWMREFSINDFTQPFIQKNLDNYKDASGILKDLLCFCIDRGLKPVICCPPVSPQLRKQFDNRTLSFLMDEFVEKANTEKVPFLNYWACDKFNKPNLFENSFFLNRQGAQLFTKQILEDLSLI